jgi:hypothetical protein
MSYRPIPAVCTLRTDSTKARERCGLTFVCKEAGQPLSPALIVAPFLQDAVGFKKYKRLYL